MASTIQIDAAAREILSAATAAQREGPAMASAEVAVAPSDFCALWKQAKPVLETAAAILTFFAPAVAGTLRGLIKLGDQIAAGMGCT